ncbi:sugar phosphate isomerase/epimerase [Pseudoruegeria sp. HB172150]|uniref:sugar phosphate isomerase/epimerase family protein n=1 Tax=Pseudoruegeria sp. HB172150 TaxID=2721164 RepID=UPI0015539DC4|nr:TIM barrel protein [Pseudoruegeria sp. HB172150]
MTTQVRPGLCSVTFRALTPEEVIALAADQGVEAIEWGGDVHVPSGDTAAANSVAHKCRDAGIACPSYGTYVRAGKDKALEDFATALDTASALGALNIRVWAGTVSGQDADAKTRDLVCGDLVEMADRAASAGITVSVEYHRNTLTEDAVDAEQLFRRCDHQNLFSYWQPVPGRGLDAWLQEVKTLGPWLGYYHVFHWLPARPHDERRPLAEAEGDWHALFAAWSPAPHWPHQRTAFLEFVKNDAKTAFTDDMAALRRLCTGKAHMTA